LSESKLFTTFPEVGTETDRMGFAAVAREVKLVRYGLDCYAYALVAAGQVDLVIEASLNAYDIQAPIGVIEAAGGIVTSWSGKPAYLGGQVLAAANQRLHKQALNILNSYSDD
jgi:fructose-1,6-bisphosphatase/inositol monophosphatase family enzyme